MPKIGQKLKVLRDRRAISVRQLAVRSGVSHSTISLIERDSLSPSLNTMAAILDALGATLSDFFSEQTSPLPYSPFYVGEDLSEVGKSSRISYKVIGLNHPNRSIMFMKERFAAGADTGEPYSHNAQECGVVIAGAIELTVADQTTVLQAGDGYYFDSALPHHFKNVCDGETEIISACNPPTY
ncbi:cupin domain-containing protein [Agrobacterium arsenijevicii]|uniref:XRE family transcriptional regulator n=1 Tax=Agrobacterium arsenijevicii TaxID=1585697 RepID=A0ABR5D0M0_9HYPH|nr:XRE family transcriptional regulator [Agrobacterium arsenijevicii]